MSEWVEELSGALSREFDGRPPVCVLATVDKHGLPRARSVICRKVVPDGSIWIVSDARSEKSEQVRANPQTELVFWLPGLREQFRLLGSVKILAAGKDDAARVELWKGLSDASRAMFLWPNPGAKRIDPPAAFPESIDAATPPPGHFEVLIVRPRRVEQLQLHVHPHRRRRWMLAGNWSAGAEVNP